MAITDHDTADGWSEAERTSREVGLELIRGMEISTRYQGRGLHLLAYLPDPTYQPLVEGLAQIVEGRRSRVPAMLERLRALDIEIHADDVDRASGGTAATGRPHVADARERLRAIARNLDLVVTGSSDHHGTGKTDHELGCNTTAPDEYARLLDLAAAARASSGRAAPEVVRR